MNTDDLPKKRATALSLEVTHYFTGKPCTKGHIDLRFAKDGACKTCTRIKRRNKYANDPEKSRETSNRWKANNKAQQQSYMKRWRLDRAKHVDAYNAEYRKANRESRLSGKSAWREKNMDRVREYARQRYRNHLPHRLNSIIRGMVYRVVSNGKSSSLDYDWSKLKARMEAQFSEGMSWENHGEWEIDHKIPVSHFLRRGQNDPKVVNALSNLQPLWKEVNRTKNNRWAG